MAATGRTAASEVERVPKRRANRYANRSPMKTNGAAGRMTAATPTRATSRSAGRRDGEGAPRPALDPARSSPASDAPHAALPCPAGRVPARLRVLAAVVAGAAKSPDTTKRPKEPLSILEDHQSGTSTGPACRCEHRPVLPYCSGPLRARRRIRARRLFPEAPYPRDSDFAGRFPMLASTACPRRAR